jgi:hypothetical protein
VVAAAHLRHAGRPRRTGGRPAPRRTGFAAFKMTRHTSPLRQLDAALSQLCCRTALRQPARRALRNRVAMAGHTAHSCPGAREPGRPRRPVRPAIGTWSAALAGAGGTCRNGTEIRSRDPWRAGQQGRCPARCIRMLPFRCHGQAVRGLAVQWRSARLPGLPGPWARNTVGRDCDVWSPATAVRLLPCPARGGLILPVRKGL